MIVGVERDHRKSCPASALTYATTLLRYLSSHRLLQLLAFGPSALRCLPLDGCQFLSLLPDSRLRSFHPTSSPIVFSSIAGPASAAELPTSRELVEQRRCWTLLGGQGSPSRPLSLQREAVPAGVRASWSRPIRPAEDCGLIVANGSWDWAWRRSKKAQIR